VSVTRQERLSAVSAVTSTRLRVLAPFFCRLARSSAAFVTKSAVTMARTLRRLMWVVEVSQIRMTGVWSWFAAVRSWALSASDVRLTTTAWRGTRKTARSSGH
jgi:hypothetical protein